MEAKLGRPAGGGREALPGGVPQHRLQAEWACKCHHVQVHDSPSSFRVRNLFSALDPFAVPHDHKKHRCHWAGTLGGVFGVAR